MSFERRLDALARRVGSASPRWPARIRLAEKFMALGYIGSSPAVTDPDGAALPDPKDKIDGVRPDDEGARVVGKRQCCGCASELSEAERLDPAVAQSVPQGRRCSGGSERYAEAAAALERALALNPRFVVARFKLALALLRLGLGARECCARA